MNASLTTAFSTVSTPVYLQVVPNSQLLHQFLKPVSKAQMHEAEAISMGEAEASVRLSQVSQATSSVIPNSGLLS